MDTSASRLVRQPRQVQTDKKKCISETCFQGPSIYQVNICIPHPLPKKVRSGFFFSHFNKNASQYRHKLGANDQQNLWTAPPLSYIHAIPLQADDCKGQKHALRGLNISIPKACSGVLLAFSICYWPHLQMPALRAFQSVEHPCCDLSLVAGCRPEEGHFLATWKQLIGVIECQDIGRFRAYLHLLGTCFVIPIFRLCL